MQKNPKWLNGFTLVELLVVISILAILAIVGVVVFSNITGNARDSKRKADIQAIAKTMEVNYNPASGYQIEGSNFASQSLPIPPRDNDYQIYYGENNQSFLACAKLEHATSDVADCSLTSSLNECFCLRSTQGSDVYPDPDNDNEAVSPIADAPVIETTPDIATGLVGYWKMDENSGNATDASGNGNTATDTNSTVVAGKFGNGRSFASLTDLSAGNATTLNITGDMTVAAWVKTSTNDTRQIIMSKHTTPSAGYWFAKDSNNKFIFILVTAGGNAYSYTKATYSDSDWHHVVGVAGTH